MPSNEHHRWWWLHQRMSWQMDRAKCIINTRSRDCRYNVDAYRPHLQSWHLLHHVRYMISHSPLPLCHHLRHYGQSDKAWQMPRIWAVVQMKNKVFMLERRKGWHRLVPAEPWHAMTCDAMQSTSMFACLTQQMLSDTMHVQASWMDKEINK